MKSEVFCSEKLGTLTGEYEQVVVDLRETQERLEMSGKTDDPASRGQTPLRSDWRRHVQSTHPCKRRTLTSSRGELYVETRELREELAQRAEELRKGDQLFIERDRELAEMSSQLAELQNLFDEVSHQLYTECKRIEGVQETVNACVKQSKELEAIHHKLEESHQMLLQMRDTRVVTGLGQSIPRRNCRV